MRAAAEALGLALLAAGVLALSIARDAVVSGDPFAVYFPAVQALFEGHGLEGLAPLARGTSRMPLYVGALALVAAVVDDRMRASQLLGAALALALSCLLHRALRRWLPAGLALALGLAVVLSPVLLRAAAEPLPDLLGAVLVLGALVGLLDGRLAGAGALAGLAVATRFHAIGAAAGMAGFLALRQPGGLRRFALGLGLGLATLLPPMVTMRARGFSYPRIDVPAEALVGGAPGGTLAAALLGLLELPHRIAAATPGLLVALGLAGLAVGLRARRDESVATALTALGLVAVLVPVHFEARYYLPLTPVLALGAAPLLARLPRRAGVGLLGVVAALGLGLPGLGAARRELLRARAHEREAAELCEALAALPGPRPLLVGTPGQEWLYGRIDGCPRPRVRRSDVVLVHAGPEDRGLDGFLPAPGEPGRRPRALAPPTLGSPCPPVDFAPLALDFPRHRRRHCETRRLELAPGRARLQLELEATRGQVARVRLDRAVKLFGLGRRVLELEHDVGPSGVELELCSGDPHHAPGRVAVERVLACPRAGDSSAGAE